MHAQEQLEQVVIVRGHLRRSRQKRVASEAARAVGRRDFSKKLSPHPTQKHCRPNTHLRFPFEEALCKGPGGRSEFALMTQAVAQLEALAAPLAAVGASKDAILKPLKVRPQAAATPHVCWAGF